MGSPNIPTDHDPEAILNAAADKFNAGEEGEPQLSETQPAAEGEPSPDQLLELTQTEPSAPVESSPFEQKLLDELGGDPKLIAQRIINLSNSNAQLTRQLTEVIARMEGATGSPEPEPDVSEAPQVKFYSEQISQIEADVQANIQQQSAIAAEANTINQEVFRLQGELRRVIDDSEKASIQNQINAQANRYASLNADYQALARENKTASRELSKLRFDQQQTIEGIKANLVSNRQQAEAQAAEDAQYRTQVRQQFVDAVKTEAVKYGITDLSHVVPLMIQRFQTYAAQAPAGSPAASLPAFMEASMAQFAKSIGLSPRQQYTQNVQQRVAAQPTSVQDVTVQAPQQPTPQAYDSLPVEEKARLVRERAGRLLGGGR